MSIEIIKKPKKLVFSAPITPATKKWGVYCIPRLWKLPSGRLVIRFNGEVDCADIDNMQAAPNLYFYSDDDGETWQEDKDGYTKYDQWVLQGNTRPYLKLSDGTTIAIRDKRDCASLPDIPHTKKFIFPNKSSLVETYYEKDIPKECMGMDLITYRENTSEPDIEPIEFNFPEREVFIESEALTDDGYKPIEKYVKIHHWRNPYISSLTELPDGRICGVVNGQNPEVSDKYCPVVYLVVSNDKGKTWEVLSTIAKGKDEVPYGYSGDGCELSLNITEEGILVCAMRMDVSINPNEETPICDTYFTYSEDLGETWVKPYPIAESSITPQLISLKDNILLLLYGRPGVHMKYSTDNGKTWSESTPIIGKTLAESRAEGLTDYESKYGKMDSYANVFAEKLSEDTFIVLFNDMKYDDGDGEKHRAGFVQKITIKNTLNIG